MTETQKVICAKCGKNIARRIMCRRCGKINILYCSECKKRVEECEYCGTYLG